VAKIAPSILAADFARLGDEITECHRVGADLLHLDIMDGHFVPNISYGPGITKTIDGLTRSFLDVHLMLSQPEKYFEPFVKAGADNITFHIEVHPDPREKINELRKFGIKAGISLNPDAPIKSVLPYLELVDYLLIMSVFPGFGGQAFIGDSLNRIESARSHIDKNKLQTEIEVDGGVDETNMARIVDAGADVLVMGTGFFKHPNRAALVQKVQALSYKKK
jgi:ribulose-phosphate 3-epimerase